MQLLVGLGNPGAEYASHRHNVGFWLADSLAGLLAVSYSLEKKTLLAKAGNLRLAKPQSYMNVCGLPVRQLCDYYQIPHEKVIVAHDDLDLPVGSVRLKQGGGHGGHNGLRDLIKHLGADFSRVRIGIGHPGKRELVHGYVLGSPSLADKQAIEDCIARALSHREDWIGDNFSRAQLNLHTD